MPTTNKMHWTYPAFRTKPYFNEIAAFFNEIDESVFDLIVGAGGVFVNETTLVAAGGSSENFVHSCKDQFPTVTVAALSDGLWVNGEGVIAITYIDANTIAAKNEGSENISPGGLRLMVLGSSQLRYGLANVTNDAQLKRAAGDFASFTAKAAPIAADLVLIEDSASGNAKRKITVGSISATNEIDVSAIADLGYAPGSTIRTDASVFENNLGVFAALKLTYFENGEVVPGYVMAACDSEIRMFCVALALEAGTGIKRILQKGIVRNDAWDWNPGDPVYVETSDGGEGKLTQIEPGAGCYIQIVGYALEWNVLDFNPQLPMVKVKAPA